MRPIPEYMKIREYVFGMIQRNGQSSDLKIEAESELCRKFQTSRITVRYALKQLVDEGLLIPKRGLGTFINPAMVQKAFHTPVIGFMFATGKAVHHYADAVLLGTNRALSGTGMCYRYVYGPEKTENTDNYIQILKVELDGIIWFNPDISQKALIQKIREAGIPILVSGHQDILNDMEMDRLVLSPYEVGVQLARFMLHNGHTRILHTIVNIEDNKKLPFATYRGYCNTMEEAGVTVDDALMVDSRKIKEELARLNRRKIFFSAVYSAMTTLPVVIKALNEYGKRIPQDISCLIYGESLPYWFNGMRPTIIGYSEEKVREAVAEWLFKRIIEKNTTGKFKRAVESIITVGDTVKNLNKV